MTAVLLAGGKSIRVMPSGARLPKALMPVGSLTVVEVLLHQLRTAGIREVIVCTGRHAELVKAVVGDGRRFDLALRTLHDELDATAEGGAPISLLHQVLPELPEHFLLLPAGAQCTLDFGRLLDAGRDNGRALTVAVHEEKSRSRYGVARLDAAGQVVGFAEKPESTHWVDMGLYAVHRDVLASLPSGEVRVVAELVERLIARGERVLAQRYTATWLDRSDERTVRRVSTGATACYVSAEARGEGVIADLSLHGMQLMSAQVLPVDTNVTVAWGLPGRGGTVSVQGVVTGVTGDPGAEVALGIRFTRVEEADHAAIDQYLDATLAEVA